MAALGSEIGTNDVAAAPVARSLDPRWLAFPRLAHPWLVLAGVLVFSFVFWKNAWVDEDAYITFRSIEQLFAGNGPRWNPHERVQVFTHPLWFLLLSLLRVFVRDLFLAALIASYGCGLAMLAGARRDLGSSPRFALAVVWLVASKSFFDFTSSGLENPLAYALTPPFLVVARRALATPDAPAPRDLGLLTFVFSLLLLTRHDGALLFGPVLALALLGGRGRPWPTLRSALLGLSPFLAWTLASLFYYGFPFPNTAYAKLGTGIPRGRLIDQGLGYVERLFADDPVTAITLVVGIVGLPLLGRLRPAAAPPGLGAALATGLALHLAYVIFIGGDYMTGRFFSASFLIVVLALTRAVDPGPRMLAGASAAAVLLAWLVPASPLLTGADFARERPGPYGVGDQRGLLFPMSSVHQWWSTDPEVFPDYRWSREGRAFAHSDERVRVRANVGFMGYTAGTEKIIIDRLALTDPLLARLPSRRIWRIGHFPRVIPEGYVQSVETGESLIVDPDLRAFHEALRLVTEADLLAPGRLGAIVRMNLGRYDGLLESSR